jgi:hypothetical protein
MFFATTNPSVCRVTRTLPSRTILNDGKFYTFDNGSCTLFTQTGYLNTTDAGTAIYYYFQNNNGCGLAVATNFTGCGDWSNLNSWSKIDGEAPEILPFYLSQVTVASGAQILTNSGNGAILSEINFSRSNLNKISICACYFKGCRFVNSGTICAFVIRPQGSLDLTGPCTYNYGTIIHCSSAYFMGCSINYGTISGFNLYLEYGCNYGNLFQQCFTLWGGCNFGVISGTEIRLQFLATNAGNIFGPTCIRDSINEGVICGNTTMCLTARNFGTIYGTVTMGGTSCNFGTISGETIINGSACNNVGGIICGNTSLQNNARNFGTIYGTTTVNSGTCNLGTIVGNAYFDYSINQGTVSGTGFFRSLACNSGFATCACLY